jgi:hypothetical protein
MGQELDISHQYGTSTRFETWHSAKQLPSILRKMKGDGSKINEDEIGAEKRLQ